MEAIDKPQSTFNDTVLWALAEKNSGLTTVWNQEWIQHGFWGGVGRREPISKACTE